MFCFEILIWFVTLSKNNPLLLNKSDHNLSSLCLFFTKVMTLQTFTPETPSSVSSSVLPSVVTGH